jgi:hypothetical protein
MTRMKWLFHTLAIFVVCLTCGTLAQAQATRTWVSGVGDDANPCSRTAPCKTFAGAISKTAAGGEISVLDPGGFGAVTITKAITINGDGTLAGLLAATVNGIIVNAGVNDVVVLRSISINGTSGANIGINGIRFLAGRSLRVENCSISGFNQNGIDVVHTSTTTPGELVVEKTSFTAINNVAIRIDNGAGAVAPSAMINNVTINRAGFGVDVLKTATVTISNSVISHVTNQAVVAENTSTVNVIGSSLFKNGTGVSAFTSGATVRIANNNIFNNTTGVNVTAGGVCQRFQNNQVLGNGTDFNPNLAACSAQTNQ